jgi:CheY-like chemotaxis protein/pSer/pThr/pTyr-binding forkhead associated (FHA) protein
MPTLRLKLPEQGEITHELTAERITIGRRPDNTIQIIDRSVSAHHAELIAEDGHYRLHDLGSTNLSFVDGQAVTDFHLRQRCKVAFGTIQCEFDPHGGNSETRLSSVQLEKDLAFLRGENADLQGRIVALQRQIDILSSARLVTKKADTTPFAAHNDALKNMVAERDDLRHLTSGLKLELENMREELAATASERDAARQACELLQAEKVAHWRELQELRKQSVARATEAESAPPPIAGLTVIEETQPPIRPVPPRARKGTPLTSQATTAETAATQRITLPLPREFEQIASALAPVRTALEGLATQPSDTNILAQLSTYANSLTESTARLGDHPISRLGLAIEGLLQDLASRPEPPVAAHIRTLTHATDLIANLLDPRHLDRAQGLPYPRVLAVDDDADLLQTLTASLELAHLTTTSCTDSEAAQSLVEKSDFDLLLLDVNLPGLDGPALCGQIRENDRYRKTPVIFLTAANTLDHRAQASLSGGNDFLPKPFNTAELTVKAETWIWKNRFGLL